MPKINALLRSEHFLEHDLTKKQYGKVSIYDAGGDLAARWYVYYSFRNPDTDKMERQPNIYLNINDFDSLRERRKAARIVKESVESILENGFNPFEAEKEPEAVKQSTTTSIIRTAKEAIAFTLAMNKRTYAESSYIDFKSRLTQFEIWLKENGYINKPIKDLEVTVIIAYLNSVLQRSSARNRNNTRIAISSMYKLLVNNHVVATNIVDGINRLHSKPTRNKTFTSKQEEDLLVILAKDPLMGLFIKFVSVNLLRPIEVCRLKVGDISIKDRILRVRAKNQPLKTKIIPEMLLRDLPDLNHFKPNDFLFTPSGPGQWSIGEVNRRNYFSDRFAKIKEELGLGKEYGIYSWRHTSITKLYREFRKLYSPFEAKSNLMLITGHASMKALESYLRDIDAELPEDYSYMLESQDIEKTEA